MEAILRSAFHEVGRYRPGEWDDLVSVTIAKLRAASHPVGDGIEVPAPEIRSGVGVLTSKSERPPFAVAAPQQETEPQPAMGALSDAGARAYASRVEHVEDIIADAVDALDTPRPLTTGEIHRVVCRLAERLRGAPPVATQPGGDHRQGMDGLASPAECASQSVKPDSGASAPRPVATQVERERLAQELQGAALSADLAAVDLNTSAFDELIDVAKRAAAALRATPPAAPMQEMGVEHAIGCATRRDGAKGRCDCHWRDPMEESR